MGYDTKGICVPDLGEVVIFLVSLAAAEVVGEMALAVTTANPIFLEANTLALPEIHGRKREGGWGKDERPQG